MRLNDLFSHLLGICTISCLCLKPCHWILHIVSKRKLIILSSLPIDIISHLALLVLDYLKSIKYFCNSKTNQGRHEGTAQTPFTTEAKLQIVTSATHFVLTELRLVFSVLIEEKAMLFSQLQCLFWPQLHCWAKVYYVIMRILFLSTASTNLLSLQILLSNLSNVHLVYFLLHLLAFSSRLHVSPKIACSCGNTS